MRTLCIGTCTFRLPSPPSPSCRCFSSMAPISAARSPAAARSPPGCRSRSGRTRRRDPICRRGSLIRRARNRRRQSPQAVAVSARALPGNLVSGGLEPFPFHPDKTLPGTLHHSGNRPAPPSDHTPLARRSAFQRGPKRGRRGNSNAPAGLKRLQREDFCRALGAAQVFVSAWNDGTLRFAPDCRGCDATTDVLIGSARVIPAPLRSFQMSNQRLATIQLHLLSVAILSEKSGFEAVGVAAGFLI